MHHSCLPPSAQHTNRRTDGQTDRQREGDESTHCLHIAHCTFLVVVACTYFVAANCRRGRVHLCRVALACSLVSSLAGRKVRSIGSRVIFASLSLMCARRRCQTQPKASQQPAVGPAEVAITQDGRFITQRDSLALVSSSSQIKALAKSSWFLPPASRINIQNYTS